MRTVYINQEKGKPYAILFYPLALSVLIIATFIHNPKPEPIEIRQVSTVKIKSKPVQGRVIKRYTIEEKYKDVAGVHLNEYNQPFLKLIDEKLIEHDLEKDDSLITGMLYIGTHESHWGVNTVSSYNVYGEHPTGIFQFLPSTFKSVYPDGDIFNPEHQIEAFLRMYKNGRIDEFQTLYVRNFEPFLETDIVEDLLATVH